MAPFCPPPESQIRLIHERRLEHEFKIIPTPRNTVNCGRGGFITKHGEIVTSSALFRFIHLILVSTAPGDRVGVRSSVAFPEMTTHLLLQIPKTRPALLGSKRCTGCFFPTLTFPCG
jgi:hypothetical protein